VAYYTAYNNNCYYQIASCIPYRRFSVVVESCSTTHRLLSFVNFYKRIDRARVAHARKRLPVSTITGSYLRMRRLARLHYTDEFLASYCKA